MNTKAQMAALAAKMKAHIDTAKADGDRDLTRAEATDIDGWKSEWDGLKASLDRPSGFQRLSSQMEAMLTTSADDGPSGSKWAQDVQDKLKSAARGLGTKALLTGEVTTPPAVEIADLPDVPTTLLDLIARDPLDSSHFAFLRQTVKTQNAAAVADNALKPTSLYTFEEIEDRARVVAHLSEPFPLRYLEDSASMSAILDLQMRAGVREEVERLTVAGTGIGEEWLGIMGTSGVSDVPFASDAVTTARRARTVLANLGEIPNAWVFHPDDAEAFDLLREDGAGGGFLLDQAASATIFGPLRRVTSLAVPPGTALLADWSQLRLRIRQAAHTLAATQGDGLFDKNQVKIRAEGRFAFEFRRPQSVAVVHLVAPPLWAASTAYSLGDFVTLSTGETLEATTAGTSGTAEPVAPSTVGGTVVDGGVTWTRRT